MTWLATDPPERRSSRLSVGAAQILRLARTEDIRLSTIPRTLEAIARISSRALGVARASVWLRDGDALVCALTLVGEVSGDASALRLESPECGAYLAALASFVPLSIPDVERAPICRGLDRYLAPNAVGALLDVPLGRGGELIGVICHEHVGGPRAWTDDEVRFADLVGTVVVSQLESERRLRAELEAAGNAARYAHLVASLPVTVYAFDYHTGALDYLSPNIEAITGLTHEGWNAIGGLRAWLERIHPDDRPAVRARFDVARTGRVEPDLTYAIDLPNGTRRYFRDKCAVVRDFAGRPIALHGTIADVTREHLAQLTTREYARRFEDLLAHAELASVSIDREGVVRVANAAFLRAIGRPVEQVVGQRWFDALVAPDDRARAEASHREAIASGVVPPRSELAVLSASGEPRRFLWSHTALRSFDGTLEGIASLGLDLTERDLTRDARHHAERKASLGELAASVAHDFNNVLQVLSSAAEEAELLGGERVATPLAEHQAAIRHARALVASLLAFARPAAAVTTPLIVDDQLRAMLPLLARLGAPIELALDAPGAKVTIGSVQLQQAVVNLVTNAAHAMRGRPGAVVVRTTCAPRGPDDAPWLRLSVEDRGVGIPAELHAAVFEPYFTQKKDQGTGLGLATVRAIVERAAGVVELRSTVDVGATFDLWFPLSP